MTFSLMLQTYVNHAEPPTFRVFEGKRETHYAGLGWWSTFMGEYSNVKDALDFAEKQFIEADCKFERHKDYVVEVLS